MCVCVRARARVGCSVDIAFSPRAHTSPLTRAHTRFSVDHLCANWSALATLPPPFVFPSHAYVTVLRHKSSLLLRLFQTSGIKVYPLAIGKGFGSMFTTCIFAQIAHMGAPSITHLLADKSRAKVRLPAPCARVCARVIVAV